MTLTNKELKRLMGELGKRTSKKKAAASKKNGKLGGRPKNKSSNGKQLLTDR